MPKSEQTQAEKLAEEYDVPIEIFDIECSPEMAEIYLEELDNSF